MANYICVARNDWADEFDANSYKIFKDTTEEQVKQCVVQITKEGSDFGTNEGWEPDNLCLDDFTITEITDTETEILERLLGKVFGTGVFQCTSI